MSQSEPGPALPEESTAQASLHSHLHRQQTWPPFASPTPLTRTRSLGTPSSATKEYNSIQLRLQQATSPNFVTSSPASPTGSPTLTPPLSKPKTNFPISNLICIVATAGVFFFAASISFLGNYNRSLLPLLSPPGGVLLMSILSKLSDYGFEAIVETAFEDLKRVMILERGCSLLTVLLLGSGVGVWTHVLFHGLSERFKRLIFLSGCRTKSNDAPVIEHSPIKIMPRLWSLLRLIFWALTQFPGIILLAIMNPRVTYKPAHWMPVSGGMGIFDASLATATFTQPVYLNYLLGISRDATLVFSDKIQPLHPDCNDSSQCRPVLLTGGIKTISPWPYVNLRDSTLEWYMAQEVPIYHLDAWKISLSDLSDWHQDDCRFFGASGQDDRNFQLCIARDGNRGLVAAYRPCFWNSRSMPPDQCFQQPWTNAGSQATALSIHRRKGTLVADRYTSTITQVKHLSNPVSQAINPTDLFTALSTLICLHDDLSSNCGANTTYAQSPNAMYTDSIWAYLLDAPLAPTESTPLDLLRNLIATVLYIYNPVFMGAVHRGVAVDTVQKGLPNENYFEGSFARKIEYVSPEIWTIWAFVGVGGFLIIISLVVFLAVTFLGGIELSCFDAVNMLRLKSETGQEDMQEVFGKDDDEDIILTAARLKVKA